MAISGFGAVAGFAAVFFLEGIPRVQHDIFQVGHVAGIGSMLRNGAQMLIISLNLENPNSRRLLEEQGDSRL